jgi:aryl-alcohol dehydrogenase-like predicted oxidoreductase
MRRLPPAVLLLVAVLAMAWRAPAQDAGGTAPSAGQVQALDPRSFIELAASLAMVEIEAGGQALQKVAHPGLQALARDTVRLQSEIPERLRPGACIAPAHLHVPGAPRRARWADPSGRRRARPALRAGADPGSWSGYCPLSGSSWAGGTLALRARAPHLCSRTGGHAHAHLGRPAEKVMDYVPLGRSGLKVSPLCLGTMMFGGPTDEQDSGRIIATSREAGINFIDTADVYVEGRSEEITGRAIAPERSRWVLATKVCNPMGEGPNDRGLSRRWLMLACEASLRRLGTDWIDVYYLHKEDHSTPLEETVNAVGDLIRQGKIRYLGLSNFRAWRIAEIVRLCDRAGIDRPLVLQPYYNALNRMPETELLPACAHYGLGVVPYSPLARGVLTGKYDPDAPPPTETRAGRQDKRMMQTEWRRESLVIARQLKEHAEAKGITPGQFALAWLLNNRLVTSPIVGPRTLEQMQDYLGALRYRFTAEDEALVDRLVVTGHPSTPGYNDPAYPIEGRIPRSGSAS